jgi:hypothetical protein
MRVTVMQERGAELVQTLEPLFPPPRPRLSRLGGRPHRGDASWAVVPSLRRPIVLVPPGNRAAALAFRPARSGAGGRKMRALAFVQRRGLMRLLPLPRVVVRRSQVAGLLDLVERVVDGADDLVVRLGRRRFNRAVVLVVLGRAGDIRSFVKVAGSSEGKGALELEYQNLLRVLDRPVPGLRPPRPQGYWRSRDLDLLALEPLLSDEVHRTRPIPVAQMRGLAGLGAGSHVGAAGPELAESDYVRRLRSRAAALTDREQRTWVVGALDRIMQKHAQVRVPLGPWHGDWVP